MAAANCQMNESTDTARRGLYSTVTRFWPQIAAVVVAVAGLSELVLGGLTADSSLELYLTTWAAATGGLWFLFEKAERALSEGSRAAVSNWILSVDAQRPLAAIPVHFALAFDRVFGEKHLTVRCLVWCGINHRSLPTHHALRIPGSRALGRDARQRQW